MKPALTILRCRVLQWRWTFIQIAFATSVSCCALVACNPDPMPVPAAQPSVSPAAAVVNTVTMWSELLPTDDVPLRRSVFRRASPSDVLGDDPSQSIGSELNPLSVNHSGGRAEQYGSFKTIAELAGRPVALRGYVVPLDFDDAGNMVDLLFVPFFGACIHVPPPPPNQVTYVHLAKPIAAPELWQGFVLRGTLQTQRFDAGIASAAYSVIDAQLVPTGS